MVCTRCRKHIIRASTDDCMSMSIYSVKDSKYKSKHDLCPECFKAYMQFIFDGRKTNREERI